MLIHSYNPDWPRQFQRLCEILLKDIPIPVAIEHVGSTSVPGLAAKAIIDMDLIYTNTAHFLPIKKHLEGLGYLHKGDLGIPQRDAFKRNKNAISDSNPLDIIPHHLYVCPSDSLELSRHIAFRNYLRKNEKARAAYEQIKIDIAREANQDRKVYAKIKEKAARVFVEEILEKARQGENS